ncbi:hypothetical protein MCEMSEM23_02573 [Rhabdaerophilaceae bacterium]
MIRSGVLSIAATGWLVAASVAAECPPAASGIPMKASPHSSVQGVLTTTPPKIAVGAPFAIELLLCGESSRVERVAIDATMPAHRHGMNYTPTVVVVGDSRYQARGMLFHMPGRWEVVVTVLGAGAPVRLTLDMDIR